MVKKGAQNIKYTHSEIKTRRKNTTCFNLYQITQLYRKEEQKKPPPPGGKKPAASAFPYYFPAPV
jgi:hypothetical protein